MANECPETTRLTGEGEEEEAEEGGGGGGGADESRRDRNKIEVRQRASGTENMNTPHPLDVSPCCDPTPLGRQNSGHRSDGGSQTGRRSAFHKYTIYTFFFMYFMNTSLCQLHMRRGWPPIPPHASPCSRSFLLIFFFSFFFLGSSSWEI